MLDQEKEASVTMTATPKRLQVLLSQQVERTRKWWWDQWISGWQSDCNTKIVHLLKNIRPHIAAGNRIELINHLRKWLIVDFTMRMFLWVPQGKRDSLTEWETPSKEKLGWSGRSCEPMSIGQPMIPVHLLLWVKRYIQRSPVETKAKWIQNWSVWSSMARRPKAGPQECVGRSDTHKGQTFEEPHTYVMKRQLNATSKSQASKK
jgi:hypothetical protein